MEQIKRRISTFKKKTIGLTELEKMLKPYVDTYKDFAQEILQLEQEAVLVMVKAKGRTNRVPSLAFQYRINKSDLVGDYHKELQQYRSILHPSINLDEYYLAGSVRMEKRSAIFA
ncbi:hypothetical protein RCG17_01990 [Neobacillus sp. PS3-12]|uniref:hypothetical protein n=1 Tax=Neobacillus sp. PS3-12 TaxID=3070677 RepID=UPI0027E17601|nr:hypothetical protein [Neobacillus sp. PS3-12]WML53490.1 hypothetical protein RCG17_01990 [Neobacillus sp. PS3-12]